MKLRAVVLALILAGYAIQGCAVIRVVSRPVVWLLSQPVDDRGLHDYHHGHRVHRHEKR